MSLESGEQFTAEIKTVTRSGIAVIRYGNHLVNIGPVTCEKGERVRLKYLGQKEEYGNDVGFAICLTEEVLDSGYDDYIRGIMDLLILDEPPAQGSTTYTELDEIGERNLGVTILGGERIQLGPVRGEVGDLVRIVGVSEKYAKVLTPHARGENYEIRFKILSKQFNELPISVGDEVTTTISDVDDGALIGYVGDIPICFPDAEAEMAQKVDSQITDIDADRSSERWSRHTMNPVGSNTPHTGPGCNGYDKLDLLTIRCVTSHENSSTTTRQSSQRRPTVFGMRLSPRQFG